MFKNRVHGGRVLAGLLTRYAGRDDVIVLGLPRGGVVVAYEVHRALNVRLDVFLVRKLGVPGQEELAMGAIATGGITILNQELIRSIGLPEPLVSAVIEREERELARRQQAYRGERPAPDLSGRTVILVDDGLATGSTMLAAVQAVRRQGAARVVVAVPVAAKDTCAAFRSEVDEVVCAATPEPFLGVGRWYEDFSQTDDAEVLDLLQEGRSREGDLPLEPAEVGGLRSTPAPGAASEELITTHNPLRASP